MEKLAQLRSRLGTNGEVDGQADDLSAKVKEILWTSCQTGIREQPLARPGSRKKGNVGLKGEPIKENGFKLTRLGPDTHEQAASHERNLSPYTITRLRDHGLTSRYVYFDPHCHISEVEACEEMEDYDHAGWMPEDLYSVEDLKLVHLSDGWARGEELDGMSDYIYEMADDEEIMEVDDYLEDTGTDYIEGDRKQEGDYEESSEGDYFYSDGHGNYFHLQGQAGATAQVAELEYLPHAHTIDTVPESKVERAVDGRCLVNLDQYSRQI